MKTMELSYPGLVPVEQMQASEICGGSWPVLNAFWQFVFTDAVRNWDDIKAGAKAGWNFDQPKK
jgi:hypothetical protein